MSKVPHTEIERKFLVLPEFREELSRHPGLCLRQGYLSTDPRQTIRIRIAGEQAFLTVKGITEGICRTEVESPIERAAAEALFEAFIRDEISKIRRKITVNGKCWEVDEFLGRHQGLWLAEVELEKEEEEIILPAWIGREVSTEACYFNSYLSAHGLEGLSLV